MVQTSEDLLAVFDRAPLNARYWTSFALLGGVYVLDFFDFFLIAFILAVIGPSWHLTYGQAALILYGSGLGAIVGSLVWGSLGDVFGRKPQAVTGTLICGVSAGLIAFLPTGAYAPLAVLRIFVGFGLAAAITPALTIVVEQTPTRWRSGLTSLFVVSASLGPLLASFTSHALLDALGWRGVAMFGLLPVVVGALVWRFQPESARWLAARGRFGEARAAVARHLGVALERVPLPASRPTIEPRASLADLYASPRLFWQTLLIWGGATTAGFGYLLWGPTIVALTLHTSVARAAQYFVYVAASAMTGRLLVAWIAQKFGRRMLGIAVSFAAAALLALAGCYSAVLVGGFPAFVILVAAAAFFVEGGLGNITPYTIEQYGVRLGSRASGLGHAAAGVGKILGPLALALIAGTSNVVSPHATEAAVLPAFLLLALCMLLVALAFIFLARETHGRAIALDLDEEPTQPQLETAAR
ncbi:MAG TPA: MFS transporter [Stellaceae bacterium]|jgi:putative MFS transporter|nr:MFS transporter [Stellaceae bacterium]